MLLRTSHPYLKRTAKIIAGVLIALLAIIVLAVVAIGTPYVSAKLGTVLTHQSGRNVELEGNIETHLWSREPRFIFRQVKVGNAEWSSDPTMFEAERIEFTIRPFELLRGRVVLPELIIEKPKLSLEKNAEGKANWEFFQNPQAAMVEKPVPESRSGVPVIGHLRITEGKLNFTDATKNIATQLDISTVTGDTEAGDSISLKGKGQYQKAPFLLDLTGASVLQLRESEKPYPFSLKTTIGKTSAEVEGTVQDPIKMEAFDVVLNLKGDNAADLFPLTGIALPPTPPYNVRGHLKRDGADWYFQDFAGKMGNSDLKGSVIWHPDQTPPYFEGNFISNNLDMADLAGFVGANKKPVDEERVIPDTPLDISRMMAMNADVSFQGKHVKAPNLLEDFTMKLHLKDGVLEIKPVAFGIANGNISANVTIEGKKNPPVITMQVDFKRLSLKDMFASLAARFGKENVSAGLLGGKATLSGTGKSLRDMLSTANGEIGIGMEGGRLSRLLLELVGLDIFRATGLIISGQDEPVGINCVVSDFVVNSGVMGTREFLIDTDITAIRGEGTVNLHDESLDLRLLPYPKKPTLISARSPIRVRGTFKHVSPGIDPTALVLRGGAAAALALLAPPAALLAFIGPGLGEDSNCAAFIQNLTDSTGAKPPVSAK